MADIHHQYTPARTVSVTVPVDIVFLSDDQRELVAFSMASEILGPHAPSVHTVYLSDLRKKALEDPGRVSWAPRAKLIIVRANDERGEARDTLIQIVRTAREQGSLVAVLIRGRDEAPFWRTQVNIRDADYHALSTYLERGNPEAALRCASRIIGRRKTEEGKPSGFVATAAGAIFGIAALAAGGFAWMQMQLSAFVSPEPTGRLPASYENPTDFTLTFPTPGDRLGVVPATTETPAEGRFAYGAPSVMIVDEPYFLSLAVSAPRPGETMPQLDLRLEKDTRETLGSDAPITVRPGDVTLGADMTATLTGTNFTVTEQSAARQAVDLQGGVTRWLWEVRGIAPGRSSLVMRLTLHGAEEAKDTVVRVVPSIIDVRSEADAFLSRDQMPAEPSPGETSATQRALSALGTDAAPAAPAQAPDAGPASCTTTGPEGRKLALVIGNEAYTGIEPLKHAKADARAVRDVLVESGFRVMHCEDLDADQTTEALDDFRKLIPAARSRGEVVAAFYYSGHGASTPTQNESYLLPVSLRRATTAQIESQGLALGQVIGGLSQAGARRLLVIIDACRDVLQVEDGEYRGLQRLNWRSSADDIVAYATRWGEKARDNGLYAKSLARWIRDLPDADIAEVLNRVQTDVSTATSKDQIPEYADRMPDVLALRK